MQKRELTAYILAAVLAVGGVAAFAPYVLPEKPATFDAVVEIVRPTSRGTGFSLPGGIVVTAAHVVKGATTVSLKTSDDKSVAAEVLWTNADRDIAVLRTDAKIPAAALDCGTAEVGDDIFTIGNPIGVEFIAAYGKIAGKARPYGPVKSVYVTNMATVYGQSGGPVFNADGLVIGLNSMTMIAGIPTGPNMMSQTLTGYGFVVPSSEICMLLGRDA